MAKHQKNKYLGRFLVKTDQNVFLLYNTHIILSKILLLSIIAKQKLFYPIKKNLELILS